MFADEQDPRSCTYCRKHNRPKISWFRIAAYFLIPIVTVFGFALSVRAYLTTLQIVLISVAFLVLYGLITLKRALICAVKLYQRFAPASLRDKCRFEPSCSEYMILAIKKYGVWRGLKKGLNRLKRCNIDNGGFDDP